MSDTSYPLPHYAASTWISGDKLFLCLPATRGGKTHTIQLPADAKGMTVLLSILKERQQEGYAPTVGTKAAPVQYDIDKMLLHIQNVGITKLPPQVKQDAKPTLSLEDLDI